MGRTVRSNVSIPKDLKARMDAAGREINWSAVACRAFERTLDEINDGGPAEIITLDPQAVLEAIGEVNVLRRTLAKVIEHLGLEAVVNLQ